MRPYMQFVYVFIYCGGFFKKKRMNTVLQLYYNQDWDSMKQRLGPGRLCYAFFHRSIPLEPLAFVQVHQYFYFNKIPNHIK